MKNLVQRAGRLALALVVVGGLGLSSCKKDDTVTVLGNWTTASTFRGSARRSAVSFVINNIAYAGTGVDGSNMRYNDFYSFDPATGGWARVTPFPGAARHSAVAFVVNNRGYVGTGTDGTNYLADFWRFDPTSNTTTSTTVGGVTTTTTTTGTWTRVKDMPVNSNTTGRYGAVGAGLGSMGYVGCGFDGNNENDFYQYNPANDTWTDLSAPSINKPFIGNKRVYGTAFVVGSTMYVATGTANSVNVTDVAAFDGTKWTAKRNLVNQTTGSDIYDYSAVARGGSVSFAVGSYGFVATGSTRQDCYQYDPSLDTWTRLNPFLGSARSNAVGFGIGNYGYVGLGANGSTTPYDDFYRLDPTVEQQ